MHASPNIIRMIKSRMVACMEEIINTHKVLVGKPEGKNHLEDVGVDERITLK
jgi:hypothetical protein